MSRTHLQREIDHLKKRILSLSAIVEESVRNAARAISDRDLSLALRTIENDGTVDQLEVEVEEDCLKILALHQPVAIDLRYIIATLKINNDLERIADLAVNMAERASFLATREPIEIPYDFPRMASIAQQQLKRSIDALVDLDATLAGQVIDADDELDALNRLTYSRISESLRQAPERQEEYIQLLAVSRHLERIGDHATNIAEDVIYMVDGVIARHRMEPFVGNTTDRSQRK